MNRRSARSRVRRAIPAMAVALALAAPVVLASGAGAQRRSVPDVAASIACTDGDGTVAVSLANLVGSESIEFVITDPRNGSVTTVLLATGEDEVVVMDGLGDGSVTIPVTADGVDMSVTLAVACDRPGTPAVDATTACAKGDGVAVVTMTNTDGDLSVHFFITDPRGGSRVEIVLGPGESDAVTFEGLADGEMTIPVMADGTDLSPSIQVACDRPARPEVTASVVCIDYDGTVSIEVANVGSGSPVVFVVTDPRDGSTDELIVQPGKSDVVVLTGMADGPLMVPVTADGDDLPARVSVACDGPGTPEAAAQVTCGADGGSIIVIVSNVGKQGKAVEILFDVVSPDGATTTSVRVGPGRAVGLDLGRQPVGDHVIEVRADGVALEPLVVAVACAVPIVPVEGEGSTPPTTPPSPIPGPETDDSSAEEPPVETGRAGGTPTQVLSRPLSRPDVVAPTGETLPVTGSDLNAALVGSAMVASGVGLVGVARQRGRGHTPSPTTVSP